MIPAQQFSPRHTELSAAVVVHFPRVDTEPERQQWLEINMGFTDFMETERSRGWNLNLPFLDCVLYQMNSLVIH